MNVNESRRKSHTNSFTFIKLCDSVQRLFIRAAHIYYEDIHLTRLKYTIYTTKCNKSHNFAIFHYSFWFRHQKQESVRYKSEWPKEKGKTNGRKQKKKMREREREKSVSQSKFASEI